MGLQVGLVVLLCREGVLEDLVGLRKPFLDVAVPKPRPAHDVPRPALHIEGRGVLAGILVNEGRVGLHRLDGIEDGGQLLVFHLDEGEGLLGDVGVRGGHGRDLVAQVADFLRIEQPLIEDGDPVVDIRRVLGRNDRLDARQFLGLSCVEVEDAGVGVAAPEDPAAKRPGQVDIRRVLSAPRRLGRAVDPRDVPA